MRNEGDIDYGTHPNLQGNFDRETVLNWLNMTSQMIRVLDDNHLITAGWLYDAESTAPYVDFISFHHWTNSRELAERIATIQSATDKPILLQEVGYATFGRTEQQQANALDEVLTATENAGLLGWMVWTAFDFPREATCFPSPCQSVNNQEHYFGLWRTDYTPKPAVEVIRSR
ncbi:MAG: glycosyl hydrolase [Chloroflexota bacterium]